MRDCHVHTNMSHDGKSTLQEYITAAKEKGIDEITITNHYDIYDGINTSLRTLDVDKDISEYKKFRDSEQVKINYGLEIGLQPYENIYRQIKYMVDHHDESIDFIIGSSHITRRKDMAMDPSFFMDNNGQKLEMKKAFLNYFKEVLLNIKKYNNEFDVYGHLDYVIRYGGYNINSLDYKEFKEILDEILVNLIRKDKGLEINTSGFRYGLNNPHPNIEILKRFKELGGYIVTMGSDAHRAEDLGSHFDVATEILKSCGFKEYAVFQKRVPKFYNLK